MGRATFIRNLSGFTGQASLYKLNPELEGYEYVVVSATSVPDFTGHRREKETYIFASDGSGKVLNWLELPGSFRGSMNHNEALRRAGYRTTPTPVHKRCDHYPDCNVCGDPVATSEEIPDA